MDVYDLGLGGWIFACICGVVVGVSKCGLPGMGSLAVPLMASVLPAKTATGALLPVLIMGDMFGAFYFKRQANWRLLLRMLPIAVVGIWLGYLLLGRPWMDDDVIRFTTVGIVLALVVMNFMKERLHAWAAGVGDCAWKMWVVVVVFGLLAGLTTMLANAAGPVFLVYLLAMRLPKDSFIGTNAWFFVVMNWIKVPFMTARSMITTDSLLFNLKLMPALLAGCLAGILLSRRLSNSKFQLWMEILTVMAALMLFLPKDYISNLFRGLF